MKKTIVFDFDGVIHRYSKGWQDGSIYDEPVDGIKEVISKLHNEYNIVIVSSRCKEQKSKEEMIRWLDKYNIEYDSLTNIKVPAIVYIDDRAITFNPKNIKTLINDIKTFEPWQKQTNTQKKLF